MTDAAPDPTTPRLGVCSWSLRPGSPEALVERVQACGLGAVQLALDPVRRGDWELETTRRALAAGGVTILSGMMAMRGEDYATLETIRRTGGLRPEEHWEANRTAARANARLARALGLELVSFHAGFLPHDVECDEAERLRARLAEVADTFAEQGVRCALETGQEQASTLLATLEELGHSNLGVNFDPANMILYGMGDPVEALERLAPHVWQVHVKDALPSPRPGEWGEEVPVGRGAVDWDAFFALHARLPRPVDLVIEREAGDAREGDVRLAAERVRAARVGSR